MKNIAFHSNELNLRGTNVAMYDYAYYNQSILNNKSYILSNKKSDLSSLPKFSKSFEVFLYDHFEECYDYVKEMGIDWVYYVKAGDRDGKDIPNTKSLIHAVFQHKDVHGHAYAYISKWLAETMEMPNSYIPYMVDLPTPKKSYRDKLGISEDAIIIGRHGGYTEFDLPFVHEAIKESINKNEKIYFIFMNTRPFCEKNEKIKHIEGTFDLQNKSDFINTCDYMIHGRNMGESFGLAIGEFLYHDKPVISWNGGIDRNHIEMLGDSGIWYKDFDSLSNIFRSLDKPNHEIYKYKKLVEEFTPENVMRMFNQKFLFE